MRIPKTIRVSAVEATNHPRAFFPRVRQIQFRQHGYWQGTVIAVLLNTNGPMDMNAVYRTLPDVPGYEGEDFFEQ